MVCAGFTSDRNDIEITELAPLCVEGRVIYAAPFDPALERPSLPPASDPALAPTAARPPVNPIATPPASPPDKRLFLIGIAAGVIAALALAPNSSNS